MSEALETTALIVQFVLLTATTALCIGTFLIYRDMRKRNRS